MTITDNNKTNRARRRKSMTKRGDKQKKEKHDKERGKNRRRKSMTKRGGKTEEGREEE